MCSCYTDIVSAIKHDIDNLNHFTQHSLPWLEASLRGWNCFLFEAEEGIISVCSVSFPLVTSFTLEKKKNNFSAIAGLLRPPFNKGSLTRLVATVQSWSMFPWRQQLISCIHRLEELKGGENKCALAQWGQRGFFLDKSNCFFFFFLGKVIKEDSVLGGLGVPAFRMSDVVKCNVKLCNETSLIPEGENLLPCPRSEWRSGFMVN